MVPCGSSGMRGRFSLLLSASGCVTAAYRWVRGADLRPFVDASDDCTFKSRFCPFSLPRPSVLQVVDRVANECTDRTLKRCMCSLTSSVFWAVAGLARVSVSVGGIGCCG